MRSALANFSVSEALENRYELGSFENGNVPHGSSYGDGLNADEFHFQFGLAVLQQHRYDFPQVTIQLIETFSLRMSTRKAGHEPNIKTGFSVFLNYCSECSQCINSCRFKAHSVLGTDLSQEY